MKESMRLLLLLGPAALTLSFGCARAYHSYAGCEIDCKYCAPPPLPYMHYEHCVCHSCAAAAYLANGAIDTPIDPPVHADPPVDEPSTDQ